MLMTAADYRESLRRYAPRVFVDGTAVASVADEPRLAPGINAVGVAYDLAHVQAHATLMTAHQDGRLVNRMLHIDQNAEDLLHKLEAVRLVCRESGCAQRYLGQTRSTPCTTPRGSPTRPMAATTMRACLPTWSRCRSRI